MPFMSGMVVSTVVMGVDTQRVYACMGACLNLVRITERAQSSAPQTFLLLVESHWTQEIILVEKPGTLLEASV